LFETYGVTLLSGLAIDGRDAAGAEAVVVVNDAFAQKYFPNGGAVGSIVHKAIRGPGEPPYSVDGDRPRGQRCRSVAAI
jgi:hypothetical protein